VRKLNITVYMKDSPHPWTYDEVTNLCTEGGLLRIVHHDKNEWLPMCNVFRIVENARCDVGGRLFDPTGGYLVEQKTAGGAAVWYTYNSFPRYLTFDTTEEAIKWQERFLKTHAKRDGWWIDAITGPIYFISQDHLLGSLSDAD